MYDRVETSPQNISVSDGDYLILWLDDLDLPPPVSQPDGPLNASAIMTSCNDYIRVYEMDSEQKSHDMALLCGNIDQFDPQSRYIVSECGKDVYIELSFTLEMPETGSDTGRGYQILYTAGYRDGNGTNVDVQETGMVASLQFPHKCPSLYSVGFDSLGQDLDLEITVLYFDGGETCAGGFLYIDANEHSLCGGHLTDFRKTVIRTSTAKMWLFSVNFILIYKAVAPVTISLHTGTYIHLLQPANDTIEEGATCEWKIQGPEGTLLQISFHNCRDYPPSPAYCTHHGVYFIDGSGAMLFYHCPNTNSLYFLGNYVIINSLSNVMYVRVHNVSNDTFVNFQGEIVYLTNSDTIAAERPDPIIEFTCEDSHGITTSEVSTQSVTNSFPMTSGTPNPTIASISPDIGIVAGGTRITVDGQNFPQLNVLMTYGDYATVSLEQCSLTTCFVMTPPGNSSDVGIQLPISLTFQGQACITTSFTFTYKPNPQVNSIYPLKTLSAGGTTLTVDGEGFESVNDPQLIVHMKHIIKDSGIQNKTMFTSSCTVNASDTLKCPTPEVVIPAQFRINADEKNELDEQEAETDADYALNTEGESLKFYLGIKLDGDQTYTDLRESLPEYSQIKVLEPEFKTFKETKEVSSREHLQITGKRLSDGLDITDYTVKIGAGTCTVVDLTANELFCMIPEEEALEDNDEHSVLVHPGTNISPQLIGIFISYLLIMCFSCLHLSNINMST